MKKMIFLIVFLYGFLNICEAQTNIIPAHLSRNDTVSRYLIKKFNEITKNNKSDVCAASTIFAKFNIDKQGEVINLKFIEFGENPPVFKAILNDIIAATKGLWVPATLNGTAVESKPVILPLIFEMETGCPLHKPPVNNTNNALMNLFAKGNLPTETESIWLAPYYMFSIVD